MNTILHVKRSRAKGLPWGYAKLISERVVKKYNIHCTPKMVYNNMITENNDFISLETQLLKNEALEIAKKLKEAREIEQTTLAMLAY